LNNICIYTFNLKLIQLKRAVTNLKLSKKKIYIGINTVQLNTYLERDYFKNQALIKK